jgi:hypothetical protein
MQLAFTFPDPQPEYPHRRTASKKERALITAVFGEENLYGIELVLDDIMELYPYKVKVWAGHRKNQYQVIGCCASQQCCFYMLQDQNIYLIHNYSTYPVGDFPPKLIQLNKKK